MLLFRRFVLVKKSGHKKQFGSTPKVVFFHGDSASFRLYCTAKWRKTKCAFALDKATHKKSKTPHKHKDKSRLTLVLSPYVFASPDICGCNRVFGLLPYRARPKAGGSCKCLQKQLFYPDSCFIPIIHALYPYM